MVDAMRDQTDRTLSASGAARKAAALPGLLGELERRRRTRARRRVTSRVGAGCALALAGVWLTIAVASRPASEGPTVAEAPAAPEPPAASESRVDRLTPSRAVSRLATTPGGLVTRLDAPGTAERTGGEDPGVARLSDAQLRAAALAVGRDLGVVRTADRVYLVRPGDG